ncbi:SDR family oxidoreductase [Edaphobacter albus]|uniref:SDR family oxidoreductase n=1 Tax=Edaphobacter sp. 4G125 TaxID=2763071 RepID=UPI0016456785|nr:SDR family oxidoreductase [Edaphobacter sp. 4G125]QNI37906.1 SDR family oxidoreductase [Edaphobacter sp. 4G125]
MSTKKVALISGANKGIGFETARQLGKQGITVLVGARDLGKGEAAASQLKKEGIDAQAIQFDVVNPADIKTGVEKVEKEFGKLDILINNAGIMLEGIGGNNSSTVSEEILRKTFDTNFFSAISVTRAFLPLLKKSEAGRIVNVSSILGSLTLHATEGSPIYEAKSLAYDASKTALNAFTVHLAHELKGTKIKVNSAHPGWVKTDMGTDAAPMEIADGAKTEVELATLGPDGPTGGYFHLGEAISW